MTNIRKKISTPFVAIIILIPLAIILAFNLSVNYYAKSKAEAELFEASQDISGVLGGNLSGVGSAVEIMKAQRKFEDVEVIAYNANGNVSKLLMDDSAFLNDEIIKKAYDTTANISIGDVASFSSGGDKYYIIELDVAGKGVIDKVVYLSRGLFLDEFVGVVNLVLVVISIIVMLGAIVISKKVTKSIALPIEQITQSIENVKTDSLSQLTTDADVEELQKLAGEFNGMNQRIYNYHESQKKFLHNASHELRTPLMGIQGYADGIEMGVFEDAKGTAKLISAESKKLTSLVDGLLNLARVENVDENQSLVQLSLSDFMKEAIACYKGVVLSRDIEISSEIECEIMIDATEELLRGLVGNIVSNAMRYAKNVVKIKLEKSNDFATLTIADDGDGIKDVDKIFDRFYKGEKGNFGIGLSIAQTSAKKLGAIINVKNQNGGVFEIKLPII